MKLSELNTDRAIDVLCEITPFVVNIASDQKLLDELKAKIDIPKDASKAEVVLAGARKITSLVPLIFKNHKQDVFGLIAAINETSVEDIANQSIGDTLDMIRDIVQDKELMDFFKSFSR